MGQHTLHRVRIGADIALIVGDAVGFERITIAALAVAAVEVHIVAQRWHKQNALMPAEHQIVDSLFHAAVQVGRYRNDIWLQMTVVPRFVQHHRDASLGNAVQLHGFVAVGQHEHGIIPAGNQRLDKIVAVTAVAVGNIVSQLVQLFLGNLQPVVAQVVAHKRDLHRAVGFQAAGIQVGLIVQFLDGVQHSLGLFLADELGLIDDVGYHSRGDPRQLGYVISGCVLAHTLFLTCGGCAHRGAHAGRYC